MAKELTDKVINEIADSQVRLIRERDCNNILNYSLLKEYLIEGMNNYRTKSENSKEIDFSLMKKIDKERGSEVSTRLVNSARDYFKIPFPGNPNESQLLELYNTAQNDLEKNSNYFDIKNYGHGTHNLLKEYLKARKLIEDN